VQAYNHSIRQAETGGSEFTTKLCYIVRPILGKKKLSNHLPKNWEIGVLFDDYASEMVLRFLKKTFLGLKDDKRHI
jgi:hypothetical protein